MADGSFAILLIAAGLTDMALNYCTVPKGCLVITDTVPSWSFSAGQVVKETFSLNRRQVVKRPAPAVAEIYVRYNLNHKIGPFGSAVGFSVGGNGELWLGYGSTYDFDFGESPIFLELHGMTGIYAENNGYDLGGVIEFRSGIEAGYENKNGVRFGVSYDHRSNNQIYRNNPGIETLQFRVSIPMTSGRRPRGKQPLRSGHK